VIKDYLKLKKRKGVKSAFIFLDEVTFVDDWWRAIKFLIDRGTLRRDVVTITGSVSLTLGKHFETFGGRKGHGRSIEVMPLSFREYYNLFYREFFPLKAKEILEEYLETGGYLAYLNSNLKAEDIIGFLKADIRALERSTDVAKEVMGAILDKAPSPISFNSIAREVGISPHTAREYVELFENLRVLKQVLYLGGDGKVYPRKERKLILRDPLLVKAMELWTRRKVERAVIYEWLVQEHLYRKFKEVFYYRNSFEIDAIAGDLKVEVKSKVSRGKYPKGVKVIGIDEIPEFLYNI
ncbi:ATP-binding protein, partial [Thermococci archaeon]